MVRCVVVGGKGQVGSWLVKTLSRKYKAYVSDKTLIGRPDVGPVDFLHVCIPWDESFLDAVRGEVEIYRPKTVIIHSTVPVGTTRLIGGKIAHSPVRGQHNDKRHGFKEFIKYVGAIDKRTESIVVEHLAGVGFTVSAGWKLEQTELAKLLCLSRYLNDLAFMEIASRLCKDFKVNRDIVTDWTMSYNAGYDRSRFIRPFLDFPDGKVGGHCVIPVARMLAEQTENEWLDKNLEVFRV